MPKVNAKGRVIVADIEAVGLLDSIREGHREDIHIIHCKDAVTGELFTFYDKFEDRIDAVWMDDYEEGFKDGDILDGVKFMESAEVLIMHNISGFDALALEKAVGFKRNHFQRINSVYFPYKTCDTYTLSCTLNPERKVDPKAYALGKGNVGSHSIEAFGIAMGRHKPEHEDWSKLTPDMIHRVEEDVEIGEFTFKTLMQEWKEQKQRPNRRTGLDISNAYWNELRMAFTVARQAQRGFAIDVKFIASLVEELDEKIIATEKAFRPHMPQRIRMKKLSKAQIETNIKALVIINNLTNPTSIIYENYMLNGDQRASYAATMWELTTKKGEYKKNLSKYIPEARGFMQDHTVPPVHGALTPLVWEEIPLGNRDAVKQILYKYGWRGINYNDTELEYIEENGELPKAWAGKIDDESIEVWDDPPEWCKGIAEWYVLCSRRNQILNPKDEKYFIENKKWPRQASKKNECRGILPRAICHDQGMWRHKTAQEFYEYHKAWPTEGHWRVPAVAFACATNTFRMRHKVVVNIPSRGLYGKEMRRIFIAGPGKMLLGCDGAGLELRMLAHFMADSLYTDIILNGDIHTFNQEMAGLPTRDMAKKFIYMFLYGSGIPNLARQIGMSEHEMGKCVAKFKKSLPSLDNLIDRVQDSGNQFGYLLSVDGRWGRIRAKNGKLALNTALNVLLQMTGSLVMKWAHVFAESMAVQKGFIEDEADFPMVAHQHDEAQMEVDTKDVKIIQYEIEASEWEKEEKRQHKDSEGRIWSAPIKVLDTKDKIQCIRHYHPLGNIYCKSLKLAGEKLNLRIETAGEYKIGESWQETH